MHAATLVGSMVASGNPATASSLTTTSNGTDGDDDPGEPPHSTSSRFPSSATHWQAAGTTMMPNSVTLDPTVTSGVYNSSSSGATVEDVALLQDLLLLDLPVSPSPSTQITGLDHVNVNALYSFPESSDGLLGVAVKTEPLLVRDVMMPNAQDATESSPNSVDAGSFLLAALKDEPSASTKGKKPKKAIDMEENGENETPSSATSQWLKWEEDPNQVLDCAELPNASTLEVRRIKNRDSMRRSRQRQRDELDAMKETVAQLESQYEELCLRTASTSLPLLDAQINSNDSTSSSHLDSKTKAREYSYMEAIEVAKRLGAENLFLKASIQDQASWKLQLYRVLESLSFTGQVDGKAAATPMDVDSGVPSTLEREEMRAIYGFSPLSDEAVKDVILDSTRQVQDVQNELLRSQFIKSPRDRLTVFGWDIRRRMEGNEMEFAFVKRFPNASAYQIMKKTWDADLKLERFRKIKSETRRLDILQHANANTYVLGRDVRFPDDKAVFRTVYLRFRMETSSELPSSPSGGVSHPLCKNGYVIGTQSINPPLAPGEQPMLPSIEDHERLVWADMTLWMEFFNVKDTASGKDCCEVRWTGKTNYKSETQAYRSAADTLLGLLRWEALAIAPVLTIC